MVMAPVGTRSTVMDTTLTFEQKAKALHEGEGFWIEEVELDGILYRFRAYTFIYKGELQVAWNLEYRCSDYQARAHMGQQSMIGYKDDADFNEDCYCGKCTDETEEYFSLMREYWQDEMKKFGVTWNPDLTF